MAPTPRRRSVLVALLAVVAVVFVVATVLLLTKGPARTPVTVPPTTAPKSSSTVVPPTSVPVTGPPVKAPSGPFTVSGNKIVAADGEQFIPKGFVLYCLARPSVSCGQATASTPNTDADKIQVAASFWHADVVRLQVAQERLFDGTAGTTNQVDQAFLGQLDSEVALANRLGMVAIITLQEEQFNGPPLPTATAIPFWNEMAQHYKSNPMVMFDLYNEPRLKSQDFPASVASTSSDFPTTGAFLQNTIWDLWKNGGSTTVDGGTGTRRTSYTFVGMQQLVNEVRATGSQNIIIAEGNHGDHDLSGIAGLSKASGGVASYALSGANIAYGIEPDLDAAALGPIPPMQTPAEWDAVFGNLSQSVPIVMAAFQDWSPGGFCYAQSPTVLPRLLSYLGERHLGLIAWTLDPGILIQGNNLQGPTTYDGVTTQPCGQSFDPNGTIGPGADLLQFFRQSSSLAS